MTGARRFLYVLVAAVFLASLGGCGKREADSQSEAGTHSEADAAPAPGEPQTTAMPDASGQGTEKPVPLNDALSLWSQGDKDDATDRFLAIQWDDPAAFADIPLLKLSDREFASLPRQEQTTTVQEAMELTGTMRKLVFHVVAAADDLATSGDTETAKEYLRAVQRHGEALSSADRLELIRNYGKAATQYAQKKLSGIE